MRVLVRGAVVAGLAHVALAVHHFKELNSIQDLGLLGFEAGGKALKHSMIGFARKDCEAGVRQVGFPSEFSTLGEEFETGEVYMDRHPEIAETYNVTDCNTFIYFPRGADVYSEYDRIDGVRDRLQLTNWFFEHVRTTLEVVNDLPFEVDVRWEAPDHTETQLIKIPPRQNAALSTFLSHHMRFYKNEVGRTVPLLRMRVGEAQSVRLSDYVFGQLTQQCENPADCIWTGADDHVQLSAEDMETWKSRDSNNKMRVVRNEEQPSVKPKFTELGYKKTRLPDDLYQMILRRYHAGKDSAVVEPWTKNDCHTNFFESPSTMIYLTDEEKSRIFEGLKPILEDWAGGIKLEPTSCYGIRVYHNNSWLREHVDTGETHIISAIMQIEQDVDEDWVLTFVDNRGDRHYITMEPGDLTLYESSTCLHGRPVPFRGRTFANVFVHYKDVK